jgi:alpha-aminoadipate/glutamate carrier protein LysW
MVLCPECDTDLDIEVDDIEEGDVVSCAECGSDFEVITANPLELKKVDDEEEDDEDDDEEEEEEEGDY